jgi:uncharacterized protein (DUF58 family)
MLPAELLRHIRRLEIRTRRAVNDMLAGQYHSVFRGTGLAFEEVREYQPGDEVRTIDWNVTARMGHPFVKRYREEREQTVVLVVDVSASQAFGTSARMKMEVSAELSALLAFSVVQNNDKAGLILFSDEVEHYLPAGKGSSHVLRLVRDVLYHSPHGRGTNIAAALSYLSRVTHRRAIVFLISDFLTTDYERAMRLAARRHDLVAIRIEDPREHELPAAGLVEIRDVETGRRLLVDSSSRAFRMAFADASRARQQAFHEFCRSADIDVVDVQTDGRYVEPLVRFFRRRERRVQHG